MSLIEGIGDEVTHFFIILLIVLIATVAWWTTNITEQRHVQTVWLLDRRRQRAHRRLTNHTHTVSVGEASSASSSSSTSPEATSPVATPVEEAAVPKPPEPGTSSSQTVAEQDERAQIVEAMDADTFEVRQRRLAFYDRASDTGDGEAQPNESDRSQRAEETASETPVANSSEITIKLKYINDDLKIVDGKLQEPLGDFKKRHFQDEISTNKLVRLIFNGQVLHQDSKTLEGCGMFDNCVVHCLVHQRRPLPGEEPTNHRSESISTNHNRNLPNNNNNNNNQGRDWDLGNFFFAIITFTLLSAWYFRYVYAHLYTVTATVGLILMTGIFTIVLFGFYFPDHDHGNQRGENTNNPQQAQT